MSETEKCSTLDSMHQIAVVIVVYIARMLKLLNWTVQGFLELIVPMATRFSQNGAPSDRLNSSSRVGWIGSVNEKNAN